MINTPANANYCATVTALDKFVTLPNCDNVKHAIIYGACVVVGKDEPAGALGLFFPVETALSLVLMSANNLYRDPILNIDSSKKGFFENHGRVKAMKFRGHKSEGFWIPLSSLAFTGERYTSLLPGVQFDRLEIDQSCLLHDSVSTTRKNHIKQKGSAMPATSVNSGPIARIFEKFQLRKTENGCTLKPAKSTCNAEIKDSGPVLAPTPRENKFEFVEPATIALESTESLKRTIPNSTLTRGENALSASSPIECSTSITATNNSKSGDYFAQNVILGSDLLATQKTLSELLSTCETRLSSDGLTYLQIPICHKYVPKRNPGRTNSNQIAREKAADRLLDGQFKFHYDTPKLAWHADLIKPDTIITITDKWHGTSAVFGRLLAARPLSWWEKILNRLGVPILEVQYEDVWASRKVIKGVGHSVTEKLGYYGEDVWAQVLGTVKDKIPDGYTVYGEIVGYTPSGQAIQSFGGKAWAYGCFYGVNRFMVYRVTFTGPNSAPRDLSWLQMVDFCTRQGFEYVELIWHGSAMNWIWWDADKTNEPFQEAFFRAIDKLVQGRKDKHNPGFPAEGIVLTIEDGAPVRQGYKSKSFDFLEQETKALDKGEENMEDSGEEV